MASTNPYSINDEGTQVRGTCQIKTIEDVNEKLPEHIELSRLHMCDCDADEFESGPTIEKGDKWDLKFCNNCKGLWGRHNARADYGPIDRF